MAAFTLADIPELTGETVIVTGRNSGIGQATAPTLAAVGTLDLIARSAAAQDRDLARRLWTVSEQLTGARSPLEPVPHLP
jgi:NAD(P)-dependent dehydrogenase (short-subunit alcohol dehydrogenase family)